MNDTTAVVPPADDALKSLFPGNKPLIGTIHLEALPGAPRYRGASIKEIAERATSDARRYVNGGIDGLIVENEGDIPFLKPEFVGPETVAALAVITAAVIESVSLPVGVLCLANATHQSIAVAKATGAQFIRANQWANAYVANEGLIEGAAATTLRYRSAIYGHDIKVFADVHVKHGSHAIVSDRSIAELTHDTEAFDADVLIATGQRTGNPTQVEEVQEISSVASRPVLVGSGLNSANAGALMTVADGAIVGSAMKEAGVWWNPVSVERTRDIVNAVDRIRR